MAARGFLGAGDLYIARIIAGVTGAPTGPFEATKFEIKPAAEIKELVSRGRNTYGQVIESVPLGQPADFTVDLAEVNTESLILALAGTDAALAQGAGALSQNLPAAVLGSWMQLNFANLTGAVAVAGSVEDVDYIVNRQLGWIKPLVGGNIAAAATPAVTGNYLATTGRRISGGTQPQLRAKFVLDGINQADGLPCIVTVHEGIIAATTAFDFLANDFATLSLPGKMKTPTGMSEPFTVDMRSVA